MFRVKLPPAVPLLLLSSLYLISLGCGGSLPGNVPLPVPSKGPAGAAFVSISPKTAVLGAGNSLQFTATSSGPLTADLEWLANGVPGGNSATGTISRSGLYTAPQQVTSNAEIVIAVNSKAAPAKGTTATVAVMPGLTPITVSLAPVVASLYTSQVQQFTATVKGTTNQGVSWFVNGNQGGDSSVGTISSTGAYTAPVSPPAVPSVTITATSAYDAASSATAAVTIMRAPATVTPPVTTWNPSVLGVPWASDFITIAKNQINVKTDSRLKVHAKGDGVTDDTAAIRAAIQLASSSGGGMVYFPASNYKIVTPSGAVSGSPLVIPSRIILRGDSSATSRIFVNDSQATSETDWTGTWGGIDFQGASLSGMTDLGVTAVAVPSSSNPCATIWNRGSHAVSELFFNNMNIELNNCRTFWFDGANELLVKNSHIDSAEDNSQAAGVGPVYIVGNTNVSLIGNTLTYNFGRAHLQNNAGVIIQGNTLIRDAQNKDQDNESAIESGGIEISFDSNIQVLNNSFQTLNAPSSEVSDGESIMSQLSTTPDIVDAGSATAVASNTLTDTNALWDSVTVSRLAQYPNTVIAVLSGPATGEVRMVQSFAASTKTLTVTQPWNPVPAAGSLYSIFSWTLANATIQGNTFVNNPSGIVLFDGCYNCVVQNNTLTNSRGIIVRIVDERVSKSTYPESRRNHEVAINTQIVNNVVSNTSGTIPAYIALDAEAFASDAYHGMGMINVQMGGNVVTPYSANPGRTYTPPYGEITQEGFFPCFLFGPAPVKDPVTTVFQTIYFWNNSLSTPVTYGANFSPSATHSCVTPSTPPTGNAP
ncbi:MAG: glycosyl hydrolase family 28-related protein [Candidatus Sulfotelmatobacter sp.]